MTYSNTYSLKDISEHNHQKSLWVIYNEKVYDITEFAQDHPGGDDILLEYGGKDVTMVMSDMDIHDHSASSFEMMEDYMIGTVKLTEKETLHRRRLEILGQEKESKTFSELDFKPAVTDAQTDVKTNQFLDLNKPLVPQMFQLRFTREHYLEQVHKPRYLNRPADFFGHPLLEPLSKTVWWVVPLFWLPYVGYNLYQSMHYGNLPLTVVFFLFGILIWTLLEYILHRFLFHFDDRMPQHQLMYLLHFVLHGFHHYLPMDRLRLVVPPTLFVVLAYPWISLGHILFPPFMSYGVIAGGMFGYVCYDMTHYYLHHSKVIPFHFREMKKYHLAHHYKDFEVGYGITSKMWDYVFNTVLTYN
ncbi:hypothetical protein BDB01DRAFT_899348 [Pilobolus umbonatus]|nr:hypothetical protein BDB01DRAFT_899348 [Pilobolus umbonatus]